MALVGFVSGCNSAPSYRRRRDADVQVNPDDARDVMARVDVRFAVALEQVLGASMRFGPSALVACHGPYDQDPLQWPNETAIRSKV